MRPSASSWAEAAARPLDGRFSRQENIPGWSQRLLSQARVLVAGAGALGNETLKNLALLGVGRIGIVDRDVVELSNLSRSVLFRAEDLGQPKAEIAATRLRELYPSIKVDIFHLDLATGMGAGTLAGYDLVLGCLDSIEARWKLNRLCRAANVAWIDAGIDATMGQIAFFAAAAGPCYECGMTAAMWQRLNERRSCLLAQQALPESRAATTATIASIVSAMQVQEALSQLHHAQLHHAQLPHASPESSHWPVLADGDRASVQLAPYSMSVLHAKPQQDCLAHIDESVVMVEVEGLPHELTSGKLLADNDAIAMELDWDVATALVCVSCGSEPCCLPSWRLRPETLTCPTCGSLRRPDWQSTIARGTPASLYSLEELGAPPRAYLSLVTSRELRITIKLVEPPECESL